MTSMPEVTEKIDILSNNVLIGYATESYLLYMIIFTRDFLEILVFESVNTEKNCKCLAVLSWRLQ